RGHAARGTRPPHTLRVGRERTALPPARLAWRGVVHARRRPRLRNPLLSGAPAPDASRTQADARSRGRHRARVPAHHAPRGRTRARQRIPVPQTPPLARTVRLVPRSLSFVLPARPYKPRLRTPPRRLVRAGAPRRGLRRNF